MLGTTTDGPARPVSQMVYAISVLLEPTKGSYEVPFVIKKCYLRAIQTPSAPVGYSKRYVLRAMKLRVRTDIPRALADCNLMLELLLKREIPRLSGAPPPGDDERHIHMAHGYTLSSNGHDRLRHRDCHAFPGR